MVSPYESDRAEARAIVGADRFLEVHVDAPIEVCEQRDEGGLYARAKKGEIARVTGVTAPYEAPGAPALAVDTSTLSVTDCVDRLRKLVSGL